MFQDIMHHTLSLHWHSLVNFGRLVRLSTMHLVLTGFLAPGHVSMHALLNCANAPHVCCAVLSSFEDVHPAGHWTMPRTIWRKMRLLGFMSFLKNERTINGHDGRAAFLVRQVVPVTWLEQQLRDRGSVLQEGLQIVVNFKAWVGAAFACHFWRFEWRFWVLGTLHLAYGAVDHFWVESGLVGSRVWDFWLLWFGQFAVSKHG